MAFTIMIALGILLGDIALQKIYWVRNWTWNSNTWKQTQSTSTEKGESPEELSNPMTKPTES